jgi:hypothetical protein
LKNELELLKKRGPSGGAAAAPQQDLFEAYHKKKEESKTAAVQQKKLKYDIYMQGIIIMLYRYNADLQIYESPTTQFIPDKTQTIDQLMRQIKKELHPELKPLHILKVRTLV